MRTDQNNAAKKSPMRAQSRKNSAIASPGFILGIKLVLVVVLDETIVTPSNLQSDLGDKARSPRSRRRP